MIAAAQEFVRGRETSRIPSRDQCLARLKSSREFDVLIIGGGSTGAGAALDATTRGLNTACVERFDFGSGTSSRSTKLIWGGSRYLANALCSLFHQDFRLVRQPIHTVNQFQDVFRMVLGCHRERSFLLEQQPHLVKWIPIAVPFTQWFIWPPPFQGNPFGCLGPMGVFPLFFKFYDSLCGFRCPPSHIMTKSRTARKFPQMSVDSIKYCSVFYEGQFDDARTNLAIALTAAREGASMCNYCEVTSLLKQPGSPRVIGAVVRDTISGTETKVYAKSVLFCGGAYTDNLRRLESANDEKFVPAVMGASGTHIVVPSYFSPSKFGMVDMNTSDGRFLFILPWQNHVLIGTTDKSCTPVDLPQPSEVDISWLLTEAKRYLNPEISLERKHVLSAWCGIRPLAKDPNNVPSSSEVGSTAAVSRDHVISHNRETGTVFAAGGKWTTYREIAEDAVDKIIQVAGLENIASNTLSACRTLSVDLVGREGYTANLPIRIIQEYGVSHVVSMRLVQAFGGRAHDVVSSASCRGDQSTRPVDKVIVPNYPFTEAEVLYSVRHEWAVKAEDILCRRTRLAFLNKEAALRAIPTVVDIMASELGWGAARKAEEIRNCSTAINHSFAGPISREPV